MRKLYTRLVVMVLMVLLVLYVLLGCLLLWKNPAKVIANLDAKL